ncbi:MAG TPA: hydroxymethylglutaryl-CoA reductase, partial [Thermoanaerobaculia bacterium]
MKIPSLILKQLYTFGSLENRPEGIGFDLKNRLSDATVTRLHGVRIDDRQVAPGDVTLLLDGTRLPATEVSRESPVPFPLRRVVGIEVPGGPLSDGKHEVAVEFEAKPFGRLTLKVSDAIAAAKPRRSTVPHDKEDDYSARAIEERRRYVEEHAGTRLEHVARSSFDPQVTRGNVENFTGVAQVPIGFAGPIKVAGEHAR